MTAEPAFDQCKVWAVSTGEYSDYSIVAYFSSEEAANRYVEIHGSDYRVEDGAPIHDEVPEPADVLWTFVELASPAPATPTERVEHCVPGIDVEQAACRVRTFRGLRGSRGIQAYGTDHTRVRKAMSERMARVIAEWDLPGPDPEWSDD